MAVKIRLRRMGARGKPFYRLVVADSRTPRDGRFIEILGYYDPRTEPPTLKIDEEKALLWLNRGAQPTDTAEALLKKQDIFQKFVASKEKAQKAEKPSAAAEEAPVVEQAEPEEKPAPKRKRTTAAASAKPKTTRAKAKPAQPEAAAAEPEAAPAEPVAEAPAAEEPQAAEPEVAQEEQTTE